MSKRKNEIEPQVTEEAGTMAKIASIFLPKTNCATIHGVWKVIPDELFVFTPNTGMVNREKIAGFDMDGTLIRTISGNVFAKTPEDWQLWHETAVIKELARLHSAGFKLCIFTNQKGVQTKSVDATSLKRKIQAIISKIELPIQVFVSIGSPNYRKPYTGMWERLENYENGNIFVNRRTSIFVGDAAGRTETKTRKKDHSAADRLFALNLGVPFQTPEQFFLKKPEEELYHLPPFRASLMISNNLHLFDPVDAKLPGAKVELLVFVGPPACGKSTLAGKLAAKHSYAVVNQDELKTWKACLQAANEHLNNDRRIIVDCTNRDSETRGRYVELAKSFNVPCRCFVLRCTAEQARHNNTFRRIAFMDEQHKDVNDIVIRTYFKSYQVPTLKEGFDEIVHVNFLPSFNEEKKKIIYGMHLLEK